MVKQARNEFFATMQMQDQPQGDRVGRLMRRTQQVVAGVRAQMRTGRRAGMRAALEEVRALLGDATDAAADGGGGPRLEAVRMTLEAAESALLQRIIETWRIATAGHVDKGTARTGAQQTLDAECVVTGFEREALDLEALRPWLSERAIFEALRQQKQTQGGEVSGARYEMRVTGGRG
ncbi:hypothetical protein [Psychromarinibacter sp. S121]|uniref:hypothetical protein n=1 Tax=Psychromarinibacter sp. S121 TaxID=3415127 RepID=UPI003C7A3A47